MQSRITRCRIPTGGGSAGVAIVGAALLLWVGGTLRVQGQPCPNLFPPQGNVGIATSTPQNALHIVGCPLTNQCDPTIRLSFKLPPDATGCALPEGTLTHHATISLIAPGTQWLYNSLARTGDLVIRADTGSIFYTVGEPNGEHVFTLEARRGDLVWDQPHVWIKQRYWGGWDERTKLCISGDWTPLVGISQPVPQGLLHVGQFSVIEHNGYWLNGGQTAKCDGDTWRWYNQALERQKPVALLSGNFWEVDGNAVWLMVDKPPRNDSERRVFWSREGYSFKGISIDAAKGGVGIGVDRDALRRDLPYVHSQYSRLDVLADCPECDTSSRRKAAIRVLMWEDSLREQFKVSYDGYVMCRELKVALPGSSEWEWWPDYVFRPDYPLMPLEELEAYVRTHRHLPGIPSAAEVQQKGGVEVGQMTAKLLEKLEELTLYLLQMHARQRELERENIALRQQLEQLQMQTMISSPMSHNPRGQR